MVSLGHVPGHRDRDLRLPCPRAIQRNAVDGSRRSADAVPSDVGAQHHDLKKRMRLTLGNQVSERCFGRHDGCHLFHGQCRCQQNRAEECLDLRYDWLVSQPLEVPRVVCERLVLTISQCNLLCLSLHQQPLRHRVVHLSWCSGLWYNGWSVLGR